MPITTNDDCETHAKGTIMATLRRPVHIVKKRSGPLEDALNELSQLEHRQPGNSQHLTPTREPLQTPTTSPTADVADVLGDSQEAVAASSPITTSRRRATIKDKDKKRERWLLTRKTWKYMADAGRKLIPEGAQNRKEDIPKIEAHFQHVCASEMRFVLWRRKLSYPGATKTTRSRYKTLLRRSKRAQTPSAIEQEEANNANYTIELLQSYLKLNECYKTTTLLGSKTVRPDQTASPSAQRPSGARTGQSMATISLRGPGFIAAPPSRAPEQQLSEMDQLLACLSQSAKSGSLPIKADSITPAILEDKALLKQIYNTLKKQQLHRILTKHSTMPSKPKSNLSNAVSLSSLFHFGGSGSNIAAINERGSTSSLAAVPTTTASGHYAPASQRELNLNLSSSNLYINEPYTADSGATKKRLRKPPTTLNLKSNMGEPAKPATPARRKAPVQVEKQYNSCGAQTNFIQLSEIKRLAEEYKARKREEALDQASGGGGTTPAATDDEAEKPNANSGSAASHHRRKSSIDNEDVSQSVSDTIKRYLRMARKKSVHDADSANRFKRVNYDRNLRNIRAKGEINPPGMDEGLNKAVQTLDAWPLITLEFIRGNESDELLDSAHAEWQKMLDERIQKKLEYEQKLQKQHEDTVAGNMGSSPPPPVASNRSGQVFNQSVSSCSSSTSAPTSPTTFVKHDENPVASNDTLSSAASLTTPQPHGSGNIFVSGSHFLSNLWHGNTSSSSSATSPTSYQQHGKNDNSLQVDVYKNGQANMQKSKSSSNVGQFVTRKILRSRSKSQTRPSVSPTSKWAPCDNNKWTSEHGDSIQLTDTSLHKLTNIEAKYLQRVAFEKINELNIGVSLNLDAKSNKRRILPKKKAITTSFFDIGKKDEQSARNSVFGNSLECCVENDRKRCTNLNANTERGSRSSLISLFRGGGAGNASKLNENVRSCESLPSSAVEVGKNPTPNINKSTSGYFSNLKKVASVQMSRSQSDMRRKSQEFDVNFELNEASTTSPIADYGSEAVEPDLQVPTFVTACIKYLEEQGLQKVGLFRVSTSKKRVKQMREVFDKHTGSAIEPDTCPHDVATLLKEFLRDLPEPLLCNHLYPAFLKTQKIRNRRLQLEGISHLIKLLPPTHRDTLYVLLKFLAKVAASSDDVLSSDGNVQISGNKMDSNNLATVFAPNILRSSRPVNESSRELDSNEKESMTDAINVIRIMIDHYEDIFKVPAELVDVLYSHMLDECPDHLFTLCEQRSAAGRSSDVEYETVPEKPARRLYTRESVMHQNDASKAPDAYANGSTRESKRHSDGHAHAAASNVRYDDYGLRQGTPLDGRRQSTPMLVDKGGGISSGGGGVVSASLQITVPKQMSAMSASHTGLAYEPSDLDDVFIDVPHSPAYNETEGLMERYYETANQQQRQQPQSVQRSTDANTFRLRRSSLTPTNAAQSANTSQANQNIVVKRNELKLPKTTTPTPTTTLPSNENEPKAPTSISSIGGAILRSKTADFEKMSNKTQTKPSTTQPSSAMGAPASELSLRMQTTGDVSPTSAAQRQHLYKRQQLIPSAKRFITTPADRKQK